MLMVYMFPEARSKADSNRVLYFTKVCIMCVYRFKFHHRLGFSPVEVYTVGGQSLCPHRVSSREKNGGKRACMGARYAERVRGGQ